MNIKRRLDPGRSRLGRSVLALGLATLVAAAGIPAAAAAAPVAPITGQAVQPSAAKSSTTGSLSVAVTGLPRGKKPVLRVIGPKGYSKKLTKPAKLTGLRPGTYKVSAATVKSGKSTYFPTTSRSGFAVKAGKSLRASVKYGRTTLRIPVSGVPQGKKAVIKVRGPKGFSKTLSKSGSFAGVPSGRYTISGSTLKVGKSKYYPNPAKAAFTVSRGKTRTTPVRYQRSTAKITVTGLPKNTKVRLKVTGPKKYSRVISTRGTATLTGLGSGTYSVKASSLSLGAGKSKGYYSPKGTARFKQHNGKTAKATFTYTSGALKLKLSNLPTTKATKLTLSGPGGYKRTLALKKTTTITGLKSGTYSISAGKINATTGALRGTFVPTGPKAAKVKVGKTAVASYSFATVIAPATEIAPKSEVIKGNAVYTNPGGKGTVTLKGDYKVGDIVISPKSATAPQGLWIRLESLTSTQGATKTFATSIPKIDEVLSRGEFSTDVTIPVVLDSTLNPGGARSSTASGMGDVFNAFKKNVECNASATLELEAKVTGEVTTTLEGKWGWRGDSYLKADATAKIEGSAMASVSGAASCTLEKTDILAKPINLPMVLIPTPLPGVAIPMINTLQFTAEGKVNTEATLSTSAMIAVESGVTGTLTKSGLSTGFHGPTITKEFKKPVLTASGTAEFYLGARADMKLAGLAGPFVTAAIGPKVTADIEAERWWTLKGQFKAGLGIDPGAFKYLGLNKAEKDDIINTDWIMAQADGPLGGSAPGNGNGGTPGDGPEIDNGSPGAPALRSIANYGVDDTLRCSLDTHEDDRGEFYRDNACATLLSVGGTLYGSRSIPASGLNPTEFTAVSQKTTGTGAAKSPKVIVTTVKAGDTGIQLVQTDTWLSKGNVIKTAVEVKNTSSTAQTTRLYRAFDCFLGDRDTGTGELHVPGQMAGCLRTTGTGEVVTLRLQAMSGGATVAQGRYGDIWDQVEAQGDLSNACNCDSDIDNAVGVAWKKTIPARQTLNLSSEISMTRPR